MNRRDPGENPIKFVALMFIYFHVCNCYLFPFVDAFRSIHDDIHNHMDTCSNGKRAKRRRKGGKKI